MTGNLAGLHVPNRERGTTRRQYSVTGDIVAFQRCRRQYGLLAVRGYVPAHPVQFYFGTLIHQVLDRAHGHYAGMPDPSTQGQLPTAADIEVFFDEVDESLRLRNIAPVSRTRAKGERQAALQRLLAFNRIEGPTLYPRVRDTEHRLQADRGAYFLHGTVDVLADAPGLLPGVEVEIWDYKGGACPERGSNEMGQYEFQMLVYCELFRQRNGYLPSRAVLYFLGELAHAADVTARPPRALIQVPISENGIADALRQFDRTVERIETCLREDSWPAPGEGEGPDEASCTICDFRWQCDARHYGLRYP